MLDWQGDATVLARRKHGESAVILTVFARDAGVINGVVPGGAGARRGPMLQPGNRLSLRWRARLADQLGTFTAEPLASRAGLMDDPATLAALNAVTALLAYALPERDPHPHLWDRTEDLLDAMQAGGDWPARHQHRDPAADPHFDHELDRHRLRPQGIRRAAVRGADPGPAGAVGRGRAEDHRPDLHHARTHRELTRAQDRAAAPPG